MYNPYAITEYISTVDRKRRRLEYMLAKQSAHTTNTSVAMVGGMAADEIVKNRLSNSAALGIERAVHTISEMEDASSKAKIAAGEDKKSRMKSLLQQLSQKDGSLQSNDAHLEFQLGPQGHVLGRGAAPTLKPPLSGKPSSCLLIRNLSRRENFDDSLVQKLGVECSRFGLVKDVQIKVRPDGPNEEAVRAFVRFDTVATAFKAAEGLNGQMAGTQMLFVCFVPPSMVDSNPLETQVWETPLSTFL